MFNFCFLLATMALLAIVAFSASERFFCKDQFLNKKSSSHNKPKSKLFFRAPQREPLQQTRRHERERNRIKNRICVKRGRVLKEAKQRHKATHLKSSLHNRRFGHGTSNLSLRFEQLSNSACPWWLRGLHAWLISFFIVQSADNLLGPLPIE